VFNKNIHNVDLVSVGSNAHGVSGGHGIEVLRQFTKLEMQERYLLSAPNTEALCQ
tara:strand:+ start:957 stop:1121 length:165 start_codon:yes stop_codon:yes gene_type:complete